MSRRGVLLVPVVLALAAAGAWLLWQAGARSAPPRNILLLTIDTLRADRLGCYGSTRGLTPALDRLASEGARLANAYTPAPLTAPSHASMLTGRYPLTHGLRNNGSEVLSDKETLLSETLHDRGFRTAAIVSALVLASQFGLDQGFDLYYEEDIKGSEKGHGLWYDQRRGDKTVDRALTWLKAEADRPFFLWVHLFDPHDPYDAPPPYKERYPDAPYDAEVAFADAQAGRLLDFMRERGLYDRTLVVVSGDHGEGLGEHEELYHGIFVYSTTTRVPLLVRLPGAPEGTVIDDLTSTIDIAPTILDALGFDPPAGADGLSLLPAIRGRSRVPARSIFLETAYPSSSYGWAVVRGLVRPPWKLIALPGAELYDETGDPTERTNQVWQNAAARDDMQADLSAVLAELEGRARARESAVIDDETRDRLLSLGYVAGQQSEARAGTGRDPKEVAFMLRPLSIATDLLRHRQFGDAEDVFRKALEYDPDNKIALIKLGVALGQQGKVDEAIDVFERAVAKYPDLEEFYRTYGWVLLKTVRLQAAEDLFRRALDHLPESGQMHFMLGYTRFVSGRCEAAVPELELAMRLSPRFGKPHYLAAICRLQAGDEPGALAQIEEYLSRDPDVESLFADPYFESLRSRPRFQELLRRHL